MCEVLCIKTLRFQTQDVVAFIMHNNVQPVAMNLRFAVHDIYLSNAPLTLLDAAAMLRVAMRHLWACPVWICNSSHCTFPWKDNATGSRSRWWSETAVFFFPSFIHSSVCRMHMRLSARTRYSQCLAPMQDHITLARGAGRLL